MEVKNKYMDVTDCHGNANHILRMQVLPSSRVIANQADEVFLRVGDKSRKLNFEQRLQLVYAKGVKYFENETFVGANLSDIDLEYVASYIEKIGYTKGDAEFYLRHNNEFVIPSSDVDGGDKISVAAILLFGVNPQKFFPRARLRFVRYEGKTAEVGERMNVVKDRKFTGRILEQVQEALAFVKNQIREYTWLGEGAKFKTVPEYPEFCWTELIVNAVAHRDYSIKGTDIQIKMYDDHLDVESPGILPGLVRVSNIREFHFSRNPEIVELLNEYDLVKEFGEGVDRIYRDMESAGLPEPEYRQSGFMLNARLKNKNYGVEESNDSICSLRDQDEGHDRGHDKESDNVQEECQEKYEMIVEFCRIPRTRKEIMDYLKLSSRGQFNERYMKPLLDSGKLRMSLPDKPSSRNQKYVKS